MARALTHNAADVEQLKYAERHNRRLELRARDDMRAALQCAPARRVFARLLYETKCDVMHIFEEHPELTASVWSPSSAQMGFNEGRRTTGLLFAGWIEAAVPGALYALLGEWRQMQAQQHRDVEAAPTTPADDATGESSNG